MSCSKCGAATDTGFRCTRCGYHPKDILQQDGEIGRLADEITRLSAQVAELTHERDRLKELLETGKAFLQDEQEKSAGWYTKYCDLFENVDTQVQQARQETARDCAKIAQQLSGSVETQGRIVAKNIRAKYHLEETP